MKYFTESKTNHNSHLPFQRGLAELAGGNALLPGSDPEDGPVIALVAVQLVMQDTLGTPGHRLQISR